MRKKPKVKKIKVKKVEKLESGLTRVDAELLVAEAPEVPAEAFPADVDFDPPADVPRSGFVDWFKSLW
jgi:hypothetical protein